MNQEKKINDENSEEFFENDKQEIEIVLQKGKVFGDIFPWKRIQSQEKRLGSGKIQKKVSGFYTAEESVKIIEIYCDIIIII